MTIAKVILQDTDLKAGRYVQDGSIEWETEEQVDHGAGEVGTCSFTTRLGATLPFMPKKYMYCELQDAAAVVRFAGRVHRVERVEDLGVTKPQYRVTAHDWMRELDGINVTADFIATAGDNDKHLAQRLVDLYWGQLATTGVIHTIYASHHNLPAIEITQGAGSLKAALDHIADLASATYWVDPMKQLHWNDIQTLAAVVLDRDTKTGDYRSYFSLNDVDEATDVFFRVTVIGAAGVTATVTDTRGYHEYARQQRYERGSPAVRIPQLPDHTDLDLTTADECRRAGWGLLAQAAPQRAIEVGLRDIYVYPGQVVDLIDEEGREAPSFAWFDEEDIWAPGRPTRLHLRLGRFQVRSVRPQPLGGDEYDYVAVLGSHRTTAEQIMRAA